MAFLRWMCSRVIPPFFPSRIATRGGVSQSSHMTWMRAVQKVQKCITGTTSSKILITEEARPAVEQALCHFTSLAER